jgi:hypothetical protein
LARNLGTLDGEFGAFDRLLRIDCSPTVDWLIDELDRTPRNRCSTAVPVSGDLPRMPRRRWA